MGLKIENRIEAHQQFVAKKVRVETCRIGLGEDLGRNVVQCEISDLEFVAAHNICDENFAGAVAQGRGFDDGKVFGKSFRLHEGAVQQNGSLVTIVEEE